MTQKRKRRAMDVNVNFKSDGSLNETRQRNFLVHVKCVRLDE